jgi:SSS family solute:Na+ symporter
MRTDWTALSVFVLFFLLVTALGFVAARWRRAQNAEHLDEWGLGGRSFGTVVSWFLLGGDLYTAYTFIAVPALIYGVGAQGFYAVPYTIIAWPLVFLFLPRLWSVAHRKGYVTLADFARGRYGSKSVAVAVALTGILATMPYIALQLVGIQAVLDTLHVGGSSSFGKDLPLLIAFAVLAAYTYSSGLRAPALIAFVKDTLVYVVVIVAIIYIPIRLGGYGHIFHDAATAMAKTNPATGKPRGSMIPGAQAQWAYATLAVGSAMALFMYPHSATGVMAAKDRLTVRRNLAIMPAYSLMLGLLSLLGFMAISAGVGKGVPNYDRNLAIPQLFQQMFPSWFAGVAFAAIGIGALVPAAIMSIAAANLFTRNIYKDLIKPDATPAQETQVAKLVSLVVKVGALGFVLGIDRQFSINLQLLGGIWILQIFPAIVGGLFVRWFHRWALLAGWAAGMIYGSWEAYLTPTAGKPHSHFGNAANIPVIGQMGYIGVTALVLNIAVAVGLTLVLKAVKSPEGADETVPADYVADVDDAPVGSGDTDGPEHGEDVIAPVTT